MKEILVFVVAVLAFQGQCFMYNVLDVVEPNCTNFGSPPSDITNQSAILDYVNLNVTCSTSGVNVRLSTCALIELGYSGNVSLFDSSGFHIRNSSCLSSTLAKSTITEFSFSNFSVCSSSVTTDGTDITYSYEIKNEEHPSSSLIITRENVFNVYFSCIFQSSYNVSYGSAITASKQVINVTAAASSGAFGEQFLFYNDSSYQYSYPSNETSSMSVIVPQKIFFGILVTGADPTQYVLRTTKCWLTPTSDSADATNYYVVTSGCATSDATYSDANEIYENNNSTKTQIGFRSFVWSTGATSLYIHCFYTLCDFVANSSCTSQPNCTSARRRRDVMSLSDEQNDEGNIVSFGPIRVIVPPGACDENNGGCAYRCVPWSEEQVICTCPDNYQLNDDGKTCRHVVSGQDLVVGAPYDQRNYVTILGRKFTDLEALTYLVLILSSILLLGMLICFAKSGHRNRKVKDDKINFVLSPDY